MSAVPRLQIDHELTAVAPALSPRSSYISNHIFSPLISKHPLRPDAPWIAFLDKRNNLLDAYHVLYPSDKLHTSSIDAELRQAFVRFNLSLDTITTPHEWWSELPREGICDEETHSKLLEIIGQLVTSLRSVVKSDSEDEVKRTVIGKLKEGNHWLEELEKWSRANGIASSSSENDSWPFDGSYPNTPLASPPLFTNESGSGILNFSSLSLNSKK